MYTDFHSYKCVRQEMQAHMNVAAFQKFNSALTCEFIKSCEDLRLIIDGVTA